LCPRLPQPLLLSPYQSSHKDFSPKSNWSSRPTYGGFNPSIVPPTPPEHYPLLPSNYFFSLTSPRLQPQAISLVHRERRGTRRFRFRRGHGSGQAATPGTGRYEPPFEESGVLIDRLLNGGNTPPPLVKISADLPILTPQKGLTRRTQLGLLLHSEGEFFNHLVPVSGVFYYAFDLNCRGPCTPTDEIILNNLFCGRDGLHPQGSPPLSSSPCRARVGTH